MLEFSAGGKLMDSANLYIGSTLAFTGATFERVPGLGELVSYKSQWHKVTIVGHTWAGTMNTPVVNLSIEPLHQAVAGAPSFVASDGPTE